MRYLSIVVVFSALLLSNCEKEAGVQSKDFPFVITHTPHVDNKGVNFSADLANTGNQKILKYGFVWSEEPNPSIQDSHKLLDEEPKDGVYSCQVNGGLAKGQTYYVRAYILTDQNEIYGNKKSFTSQGSLPPAIKRFEPKSGLIGTQVIIEGENFALSKAGNSVKFGDNEVVIDSVSENQLVVTIPKISKAEIVQITIETAGMTATSQDSFDLRFPWTKKSDFPGLYLRNTNSFELNGKIYVFGGVQKKEFWEYNPATDQWTQKNDFPGIARQNAIAFACNGKGYYGMGTKHSLSNIHYAIDIWEYDPDYEQWIHKTNFPGTPVIYSKAFVIGNKAFIGPGKYWDNTNDYFVNDFWEYDVMVNSWKQKSDFPGSERSVGMVIATEHKGYIGLGNNNWRLDDFYQYDPLDDSWELSGNYPGKGHNNIASLFINGKLYMGMGSDNSGVSYDDFWELDLATNSWKEMTSYPIKLSPSVYFTIDNKGYIGYGWYDMSSNDMTYGRTLYEFDPGKN